jgi:hypothetical protein
VTIGLFLLAAWIFFFELTVVAWIGADFYAAVGASASMPTPLRSLDRATAAAR